MCDAFPTLRWLSCNGTEAWSRPIGRPTTAMGHSMEPSALTPVLCFWVQTLNTWAAESLKWKATTKRLLALEGQKAGWTRAHYRERFCPFRQLTWRCVSSRTTLPVRCCNMWDLANASTKCHRTAPFPSPRAWLLLAPGLLPSASGAEAVEIKLCIEKFHSSFRPQWIAHSGPLEGSCII